MVWSSPTARPKAYTQALQSWLSNSQIPLPSWSSLSSSVWSVFTQDFKDHKVLTGVVLFMLMLCAMVFNKVSLVWLLGGTIINSVRLETWYAAFGLVLIVPEAVALIKVFWNTSFIKRTRTHQWPSGVALFVGFMVSFAEVSSFMVFTLEVAPRLPVQILLPLLSAVFCVSLCHEIWETFRFARGKQPHVKYDTNFTLTQRQEVIPEEEEGEGQGHHGMLHNWKRLIQTVLSFSGVWATCAISGIVALTTPLPWFQALCLPACLCLLSLCWHPKVQVYIVRSHDGSFLGRWKATCLYTIFKIIILMVGLSIIMVIRLKSHGVLDRNFFFKLWDGLYACRQKEISYPLIIHFTSSFAGHVLAFVAATFSLPGVGITLPSLLSTPASIGLVMYLCSPGFHWLDDVMCYANGAGIWCACILAGLIWIAPLVIHGHRLNRASDILLKPFDELFIQPTWNSIFLDQHMCLNYKYDGFGHEANTINPNKEIFSRIFICTTMYREANFEMARLLKSLHSVSQSKKLKNVYLEAHIFLDNGTTDLHLTDFASQLLSLLESTMHLTVTKGNSYDTPYGVQLNWVLPSGMPFFIHLKDSGKVKPKKRWSQVMYMSYVLNYRVLMDQSQQCFARQESRPPPIMDDSILVGYASDKEWEKNNVALSRKRSRSGGDMVKHSSSYVQPEVQLVSGGHTPYLFRENRTSLPSMIPDESEANSTVRTSTTNSITSLLATFNQDGQPQTSSDQGIGNSDEVSIASSTSTKNEDVDSSEADPSRQNSIKRDENWQDYEGDVSSNNESSLTSQKAKRAKDFLHEDRYNTIYESSPPLSSSKSQGSQGLPERPSRPKRHASHPPRKHRQKKDQKDNKQNSPKPQVIDPRCLPQDIATTSGHMIQHRTGHVNLAFDVQQESSPRITHLQRRDSEIFAISRKTVPSYKSTCKKRIPLDDHTYILATDADMEFTDDSVNDLLDLCNHDKRLGGACGRTHPIGQRTGPLVWYQKFEYAKDFWMIKSAQNIIGSVMCCPGCFSLYRAAAVRDVMANYASPTEQPFDVFIKDTGEDRWMCTLMMLHGWKLEYTAFCDNTTYCPDTFDEFMKQRRRWVLSDMANMLLVFKNIFKLAQKNDSFSIAYILYMLQLFTIVLLSPASTVVILAGGLDIVYGLPFEIAGPVMGVIILTYALICLVGSLRTQTRVTFFLTIVMGLAMLLVVIGGSVFVVHDMMADAREGTLKFQEYYLILLLIAALVFAAIIHPRETWILGHGLSYLLGFPAMQILLPIYAMCNIVDQSWGTRDQNKSKSPPVSCFAKNRKKYHKSLTKDSKTNDENDCAVSIEEDVPPVECTTNKFKPMAQGVTEEANFWARMRQIVLGRDVNLGLTDNNLSSGLRTLRNICLLSLLILNALWLVLLSFLYFYADLSFTKVNVYGLIAGAVYGLVLFIQLLGMMVHRINAVFTRFGKKIFGGQKSIWIYTRTGN